MDSKEIVDILKNKEVIEAIKSLLSSDKAWTDYLSALLTPVIALFGIYIAWQQKLINRWRFEHERRMDEANFKHNVFDRRYDIYEAVVRTLVLTTRGVPLGNEDWVRFIAAREKSAFIFDKDIADYLRDIDKRIQRLEYLKKKERSEHGERLGEVLDEAEEIVRWMEEENNNVKSRFMKYMHL